MGSFTLTRLLKNWELMEENRPMLKIDPLQ